MNNKIFFFKTKAKTLLELSKNLNQKFYRIITFTGFKKNNLLMKNGDINFWINSKNYNQIESIHNFWLLMMVDMIKKI